MDSSDSRMTQKNNPLHGITLETMLRELVERIGWKEMGARVRIKCFNEHPSVISSLKFLRKTAWARKKVEKLYLDARPTTTHII